MTDESIKIQSEQRLGRGVHGNLALTYFGAGEPADTTTSKDPIVGFVFDAKGLIADISLKVAKFSKVNKIE